MHSQAATERSKRAGPPSARGGQVGRDAGCMRRGVQLAHRPSLPSMLTQSCHLLPSALGLGSGPTPSPSADYWHGPCSNLCCRYARCFRATTVVPSYAQMPGDLAGLAHAWAVCRWSCSPTMRRPCSAMNAPGASGLSASWTCPPRCCPACGLLQPAQVASLDWSQPSSSLNARVLVLSGGCCGIGHT